MYPDSFCEPIEKSLTPLKEWLKTHRMTYDDAEKHFGFTKVAIQKMISNEKRDVGVWADCEIVETKKVLVKAVHAGGQLIGYPVNQEIIICIKLTPNGKMVSD
jgi:hypothetical protein